MLARSEGFERPDLLIQSKIRPSRLVHGRPTWLLPRLRAVRWSVRIQVCPGLVLANPLASPVRERAAKSVRAATTLPPLTTHLDLVRKCRAKELSVSAEASEMVSIPRAELDALQAELRRLRQEVGRAVARARIQADPGPGDDTPARTRGQLADAWGISE